MPALSVHYPAITQPKTIRPEEMRQLIALLQQGFAEVFSNPDWKIEAKDVTVYDQPLAGQSVQTHTVILRSLLHRFGQRSQAGQEYTDRLAATAYDFLNTEEKIQRHGIRTVGVQIALAEVFWASVG